MHTFSTIALTPILDEDQRKVGVIRESLIHLRVASVAKPFSILGGSTFSTSPVISGTSISGTWSEIPAD